MTTAISRPAVKVRTKKTTSTRVAYTPQLPACIVGPCRSILPVVDSAGSANASAKVSVPATVLGTDTDATKAVAGLTLKMAVDYGASQSYTFPSFQSATQFSMTSALVASLIDSGFDGVAAKIVGQQVKVTSATKGDGAAIKLEKSNMRIGFTMVGGQTIAAGNTLYNGSVGDAVIGLVESIDLVNGYLIAAWTGTSPLPVSGDDLRTAAGGVKKADATTATTVLHELGLQAFTDAVIEGVSSYRNQDTTIPFSALPAALGNVSKMVFDTAKMSLYRLQNGSMKLFDPTASVLTYKSNRASRTSQTAELVIATGGAKTENDAVIYVSRLGLNGSTISVAHTDDNTHPLNVTVSGKAIVVHMDTAQAGHTAAAIAAAVNADVEANLLVTAYAGGTGGGAGLTQAATRLTPRTISMGPAGNVAFVGTPFDDGDSDTVTPYLYADGAQASVTVGTGNAALTFTAKGGPSGNYNGSHGNSLTVTVTTADPSSTATGADLTIKTGNGTAATVAAEVNLHLGDYVTCTAGGDGSGTVVAETITTLTGGVDPVNFATTPDQAVVIGQRTVKHFTYRRIRYSNLVNGPLVVGTSVTLSGSSIGTIAEVDATTSVIFLSTSGGEPLPAVGNGLASGGATFDVAEVAGAGVSAGDTLVLKFDTFSLEGPGANALETQVGQTVTVTFSETTSFADVKTAVNAAVNAVYGTINIADIKTPANASGAVTDPTSVFGLDLAALSARKGLESSVTLSGSAVEKIFGLMPGGSTYTGIHEGVAYKAKVGDVLWNGTTQLGKITAIDNLIMGSRTFTNARLRIATDTLKTTSTYTSWWIQAKNITVTDGVPDTVGGDERPLPAVIFDGATETIYVTQNQARATDGSPLSAPSYPLYVSYNALRKDLSAQELDAVIALTTVDDIEEQLGEISTDNPLAYAAYLAMSNAPNVAIYALGISAEGAGEYEAYKEAFEFLEPQSVYAIAPLTLSKTVHAALKAHCEAISDPEKATAKPRIGLVCETHPTEKAATTVASGSSDLTNTNTVLFGNSVNIEEALTDAGIDPGGSWADFKEAGVYLTTTTTPGNFSILAVSDNTVTLSVSGFDPGENDDSFYSTTALDPDADPVPVNPDGEVMRIHVRGGVIVTTTSAGRTKQAQAMADRGQEFASESMRFIQPDTFETSLRDGSSVFVPGYYAAAGIAGQMSGNPAFQPLSEMPLSGFRRAIGSNDRFSEEQLSLAAGGGVWWVITENGVTKNRHALTTDVSSIESRTDSIVRTLDFTKIFLKSVLAPIVAKYNIDNNLMTHMSLKLDGARGRLVTGGYLTKLSITRFEQDPDNPLRVIIEASGKPPYPCEDIDFTLFV